MMMVALLNVLESRRNVMENVLAKSLVRVRGKLLDQYAEKMGRNMQMLALLNVRGSRRNVMENVLAKHKHLPQ